MDGESAQPRRTAWQIGLATFGILALELGIIRWTSAQVRILAYFSNVVLIAAFLGMGLGVALGRRRPGLVHWTLPSLLVVALPLAFSGPLGLMHMRFPDPVVHLWGAEIVRPAPLQFAGALAVFLALFAGITAVFLCAGSIVGELFPRLAALRAYSADLVGSLAGIVGFTAATFLGATPPVWLLLGGLPFALLSRRLPSWAALAIVVGLGWHSIDGAVFSAYNRLDLDRHDGDLRLSANRDSHQYLHDLSDRRIAAEPPGSPERQNAAHLRHIYDLPFGMTDGRDRALVVGAGTGNDVKAALRAGFATVYSVEIDREILAIGRRLHPERPYDDPRVQPVVDDARGFFERYRGAPFDVVCYGFLDSHAMLAAMSSLRLDNYVYTAEGIRAAWRHLAPGGVLSVSFSVLGGGWVTERLYWTITAATGIQPVVVDNRVHYSRTFLVSRDPAGIPLDRLGGLRALVPVDRTNAVVPPGVATTSDDWPFLYIRPNVFPLGYVAALAGILAMAMVGARLAFGRETFGAGFDPVMFLIGAAFLLIETRGVTTLSLLFGSTWVVNAAIFAGILVMVLLANLLVERASPARFEPFFLLLFGSVALLWALDRSILNQLPLLARGVIGGLVNGLPIGFAGVIVSMLLARSSSPTASLGSNLLGSVVGGCLEYLSMALGLRMLALLALALYLGAFLALRRRAVQLAPGWVPRPVP
jgi:SAM-dependent methyltransferase